jgi:glycosyltransferase involved in cell wall biosynthesis
MGRNTLDAAIKSVLNQTLPASEIIIVAGGEPTISEENLAKVKVIRNYQTDSKIWTAAHNRNIGIMASNSNFVAFLDDDDLWKSNKMQIQLDFLLGNPGYVSLSSASYKVRKWFFYKRPLKVLKENQNVLRAHYGKKRFFPTPFYTPTPGIVVPNKIAKSINFDEMLPGFEDTWWLHEIQNAGFKIFQHKLQLVIINANPIRSISRDSLSKNIAWAKKIEEYDLSLAVNYLQGICVRNALISGQWNDLKVYLNPIKHEVFGSER